MNVLGIDTTADDTCAAIVEEGRVIRSDIVCSQSSLHAKFGGIVPQMAAYEHLRQILPAVEAACRESRISLTKIDLIATGQAYDRSHTYYLVCLETAKILAWVLRKPLVGVDHIAAHISVNFLVHPQLSHPFIALTVAGGHTILVFAKGWGDYQILGQTRDDAAGEAFDKVARLLGLGYPGGPAIDEAAKMGDADAFNFRSPMKSSPDFDFSYSGLKTAVVYEVVRLKKVYGDRLPQGTISNLAASFRRAAIDVLVEKLLRASEQLGIKRLVLGGGVAANDLLRREIEEACREKSCEVFYPPKNLCTDNAVGTAVLGYHQFQQRGADDLRRLSYFREKVLS